MINADIAGECWTSGKVNIQTRDRGQRVEDIEQKTLYIFIKSWLVDEVSNAACIGRVLSRCGRVYMLRSLRVRT